MANSPIYTYDPYKAVSPIMIDFVKQSSDLVKGRGDRFKEDFVRALVEAVNSELSYEILGRDIFD